jgi:hypothetical protein
VRSESVCIERCNGVPIAFVCRTELAKGSMHRIGEVVVPVTESESSTSEMNMKCECDSKRMEERQILQSQSSVVFSVSKLSPSRQQDMSARSQESEGSVTREA